jgi:predicted acetyltransferase
MTVVDGSGLRLRLPVADDEHAARTAHEELQAEDFTFCLGLDACSSWAEYLTGLDAFRRGEHLPQGFVPSTFLFADVDGVVVGRTSIRHELNEFLEHEGGHIGYAVRPGYRRRGYATAILRQSLEVAHDVGLRDVLVCCDDDNVGSSAVIESCGGVLDSIVESSASATPTRRYWIRNV